MVRQSDADHQHQHAQLVQPVSTDHGFPFLATHGIAKLVAPGGGGRRGLAENFRHWDYGQWCGLRRRNRNCWRINCHRGRRYECLRLNDWDGRRRKLRFLQRVDTARQFGDRIAVAAALVLILIEAIFGPPHAAIKVCPAHQRENEQEKAHGFSPLASGR
jgi:hypothetical protein